jgi:hypothetical protein
MNSAILQKCVFRLTAGVSTDQLPVGSRRQDAGKATANSICRDKKLDM